MPSLLPKIIPRELRPRAVLLAALMTASALTEGTGVLLLVPLLTALEPAQPGVPGLAHAMRGMDLGLSQLLALFVALVSLRAGLNFLRAQSATALELGVVERLRSRVWQSLLAADWRTLSALRRSDSASILISGIDQAGAAISQAIGALAVLATLAALTLAGIAIAPVPALGGLAAGSIALLAYRRLRRRAVGLGDRMVQAYARMHGSLGETLDALRMVKSLGAETRARYSAVAGFAELSAARRAYQRDVGLGQLALQIGSAAGLALLVWLAIARWHAGLATVIPMVAVLVRAVPLLGALQERWQNYLHARAGIVAALSLIDRADAAREPDLPPAPPPELKREIVLDAVTVRFAAEGSPAIDAVSLSIPSRGLVALSGPSGAGKSTLADLLGGLIVPDSGEVRIDGVVLDPAGQRAWRSRVAYVQQDPALLADTLRANLLWGLDRADDAAMGGALRAAACDFVSTWPAGLETRIGDGGRIMSGGERQRLMLARALLRRPALLILDEATSALDAESEGAVVAALGRLKCEMAVVVIAHRGALTDLADRTYRLEAGRLVS